MIRLLSFIIYLKISTRILCLWLKVWKIEMIEENKQAMDLPVDTSYKMNDCNTLR